MSQKKYLGFKLQNGKNCLISEKYIVYVEEDDEGVNVCLSSGDEISVDATFNDIVESLEQVEEPYSFVDSDPDLTKDGKDEQLDERSPGTPDDKQTSRSGAWPGEADSK